jgi:hypothetical protein
MKKFKLITKTRKLLADTITPVSIYLKIRDASQFTFVGKL